MRAGRMQPGIAALFRAAGRDARAASRLRSRLRARPAPERGRAARRHVARHRMPDHRRRRPRLGARPATRRDQPRAARDRSRHAGAGARASSAVDRSGATRATITLFDPDWHQGVIGIVASRLKEKFHRPIIHLRAAPTTRRAVKGSGRSIPGLSPARRARPGVQARARPDRSNSAATRWRPA